nr:reverse transcriptase domain-containing protein [Tanacetum cinerariifolium]
MNVVPPDHVGDVPVVEPNQHDDVPVVLEPVLVDKDEDLEEDEFEKEKDPQEEEDDMEVDIEEDKNEPDLTYPYKEVDLLNPLSPASESEPKDVIEAKNPIKHEDETVPASVQEVGESSTAPFLYEESEGLFPGLMRRDINSLLRFNELALMCPRMVKPKRVKVDAYILGLTDNIKGEVTSSKPANLNEAIRMAHKLME